jgi:hypothetical protein
MTRNLLVQTTIVQTMPVRTVALAVTVMIPESTRVELAVIIGGAIIGTVYGVLDLQQILILARTELFRSLSTKALLTEILVICCDELEILQMLG